jgi:hypothetical protein
MRNEKLNFKANLPSVSISADPLGGLIPQEIVTGDILRGYGPRRGNRVRRSRKPVRTEEFNPWAAPALEVLRPQASATDSGSSIPDPAVSPPNTAPSAPPAATPPPPSPSTKERQ